MIQDTVKLNIRINSEETIYLETSAKKIFEFLMCDDLLSFTYSMETHITIIAI